MSVAFHLALNLQFDGLLREGEDGFQQPPAYKQQDDNQRRHEHHPLTEAQSHVQSLWVVEIFQGDGVRRCADGCSHTTEVGSQGNAECHGYAPFALGRQLTEYWCQEGQHHGCRCCVGHEHGEQASNEDESQQYVVALVAERLQQHFCQLCVQSRLGGGNGQYESADEQHDDRVGKGCHDTFIRQQCAYLFRVAHPLDTRVRAEQQHQSYDGNTGSPRRHHLKNPHQRSEGEDSNDALLHDGQSLDAKHVGRCIP